MEFKHARFVVFGYRSCQLARLSGESLSRQIAGREKKLEMF